jgi:hypothetical protein
MASHSGVKPHRKSPTATGHQDAIPMPGSFFSALTFSFFATAGSAWDGRAGLLQRMILLNALLCAAEFLFGHGTGDLSHARRLRYRLGADNDAEVP